MTGLGRGRAWVLATLVTGITACGRAEHAEPAATLAASAPAESAPVEPADHAGPTDASEALASDAEAGGDALAAAADAVASDAILPETMAVGDVVEEVSESVSPERCKTACDNAKRVTLAELPADIAPSMREAIEHAMTRECPRRCVERASGASVQCIESARTALELAGCPR